MGVLFVLVCVKLTSIRISRRQSYRHNQILLFILQPTTSSINPNTKTNMQSTHSQTPNLCFSLFVNHKLWWKGGHHIESWWTHVVEGNFENSTIVLMACVLIMRVTSIWWFCCQQYSHVRNTCFYNLFLFLYSLILQMKSKPNPTFFSNYLIPNIYSDLISRELMCSGWKKIETFYKLICKKFYTN